MIKYLFLSIALIYLVLPTTKSQSPERGLALPIATQNAIDLAYGYNGGTNITDNYDHMFFLKPERFGPALLLRAGLGDGLSPGYGMLVLTELAYTSGYLTFVELGAGYSGQVYEGDWCHLPYFLASFRYRANSNISIRLTSRLIMNPSEEIPLFGMGFSVGYTF